MVCGLSVCSVCKDVQGSNKICTRYICQLVVRGDSNPTKIHSSVVRGDSSLTKIHLSVVRGDSLTKIAFVS